MKVFIFLLVFCSSFGQAFSSPLEEYWLVQEDFIKFGKGDLYLAEKGREIKELKTKTFGIEDLENPQYVFLSPLKQLADLSLLEPFAENRGRELLKSCLNFQIFSLHMLLEVCSLRPEGVFSEKNPYLFYALYEVNPGTEDSFEGELVKAAAKLKSGKTSWSTWKCLLAGDCPKYLVCLAFKNKGDLKDWSMDSLFNEEKISEILRGKKSGWMKREKALSN